MKDKKTTLLDNAYASFIDLMLSSNHPVDQLDKIASEDIMGYGTTLDEKIHDLKELKDLAILQREQSANTKLHYKLKPIFRKILNEGNSAIFVDQLKIIMNVNDEINELIIRLSTILDFVDGQWKVVHWHGSKPEYDSGGTDPWHKEEWQKKNEELQKLVEEKTTDLLTKNHELEIEASLERVRAVAMSMQKSDDILDVCHIISDQLEQLNISSIRNIQVAIIDESKKNYLNYQYFTPYSKKVFEVTEYENNPESQGMVSEMQKSAKTFYKGSIQGQALKEFSEWRIKYDQFPDPLLNKTSAVYYYFYSIGNGGLGLTTYKAINKQELAIFKRFHKVFELAYRRFHDIEKAEAQAREAQIEAALEKVRGRSLAMHTANELGDVVAVIVEKLKDLNVVLDANGVVLCTYFQDSKDVLHWIASPDFSFAGSYLLPYFDHPIFNNAWDSKESGESYFSKAFSIKEKNSFFEYAFEHSDYKHFPDDFKKWVFKNDKHILSFAWQKNSAILIPSHTGVVPSEDDVVILKRFAKVFEQAYVRFMDLQKAEAQAREAEIETSLERVRSRTMAMQKSEDLQQVVVLLYKELMALGVTNFATCGYVEVNEKVGRQSTWVTNPGGDSLGLFFLPLEGDSVFDERYAAWKQQQTAFHQTVAGKKRIKHLEYAITTFQSKEAEEMVLNQFPDPCIFYCFNFSHGYLHLVTGSELNKKEESLLARFTRVFEQTYARFLDLQKAEAQAREAQIELSLERIRARVTAMQESADLLDIVVTMRTEFVSLGHEAHYFWYMRWLDDKYEKAMTSGDGTKIGMIMSLPRHIHGDVKLVDDWEKSDEPTVVFAMDVETAVEYIHKMITLGDFKQVDPSAPTLDDIRHIGGLTFIMARTQHGEIGFSLPGAVPDPPQESLDTLERFAAVFDLAYRRFEDLKDAEQRNRETQIELALERVRARAMAMQQPEELKDVAVLLRKEMGQLGVEELETSSIYLRDKEITECWYAIKDVRKKSTKLVSDHMTIRLQETRVGKEMEKFYHSIQKQKSILMKGEGRKEWINYCASKSSVLKGYYGDDIPERTYHIVKFAGGFMGAASPGDISNESWDLMQRSAKVFSLAYTRFNDLQQAAARARETQIELALERVRSKTMAMHNSDDMAITVITLFDEVLKLGLDDDIRCGIGILEGKERMETRSATLDANGEVDLKIGMLDMSIHPMLKRIKKAWKSGGTHFIDQMSGKDVIRYYTALNNEPDYPFYVDLDTLPKKQFHNSFSFSDGILFAFSPNPMTEEAAKVMGRFARVFGQTYTRYVDLQKAEAQAREAQIEAALERVRSKAMAMFNSEDLSTTVDTFFAELSALNVTPHRSGMGVIDPETQSVNITATTIDHKNKVKKITGRLKLSGHPVLDNIFKHWKIQKEYFPVLRGKEILDYYKVMNPQVAFPDFADDETQYGYYFYFKEGGVYAWTDEELPEKDLQIFRKFNSVLSLTYRRYIDLKEAEAQAMEAIKQSSLDRVRGKIASMRSPEDLHHITPLIWSELETLEVPFIRCGAFMIDEIKSNVQVYLTTPEGKAIGALNLPIDANELTINTVEHWRNEKVHTIHWNKADFVNWMQSMISLGQIETPEQYQGYEKPPESLDLHFIPFKQGMLYVGNTEPLLPEKIDLVKTLAEAFSIAYARYEDFVNLEEAKTRVEKTLDELKSTQTQLIHSEKMASLGELTAGIAHEIQNPLNFVNNFSEVSVDLIEEMDEELVAGNTEEVSAIAEDLKQNLEKITSHGKRASFIVRGMLEHSRTNAGDKKPTDINVLADEFLRLAYHGLRAKDKSFNAEFITEFDDDLPEIKVISQDFGRVLLNLINNAFYAVSARASATEDSGYKPTVIVSTKKLDQKIEISVKDNGNGIPEDIKEKIFQPFFTTKPTGEGTGLGLSLSYDIITKGHNGDLKVHSIEGEGLPADQAGTEFIIDLPIN